MAAVVAPARSAAPNPVDVVVTPETRDEYEAFFLANYTPTVRLLMSMGASQEQAQDAAQDAFIRLYTRWSRIRRHDAPVAWLRRVAINRLRDLHRSDTRRENRENRVMPGQQTVMPAEDTVASDDETRRLLLGLPHRQRTVAALFYVEDMSVDDIASTLGLTSGAVKFHLNRARKRLRTMVEEDEK
jgi:RNA polymerase sigma factor (sigma-70 family)